MSLLSQREWNQLVTQKWNWQKMFQAVNRFASIRKFDSSAIQLLNLEICSNPRRMSYVKGASDQGEHHKKVLFLLVLIAPCFMKYLYWDWSLPPMSGHLSFWSRIRKMLMKRMKFTLESDRREVTAFLVCSPLVGCFSTHADEKMQEFCVVLLLIKEEDGKCWVHVYVFKLGTLLRQRLETANSHYSEFDLWKLVFNDDRNSTAGRAVQQNTGCIELWGVLISPNKRQIRSCLKISLSWKNISVHQAIHPSCTCLSSPKSGNLQQMLNVSFSLNVCERKQWFLALFHHQGFDDKPGLEC